MNDNDNNDLSRRERQRQQAMSAVANVAPRMLTAMTEMSVSEPETLAAIVTMVNALTDESDVAAYAVTIAPRMWLDRRNNAPLTQVVQGAVGKARRTVALAGWDTYGDMTDALEMGADDDARTSLSQYGTAPADSQFSVTYGDACETAAGLLPASERETLATAGRAYVRLRREYDGVGRPVALAGALAATEGLSATDSRYHAVRRMTLAACKRVPRGAVLALTGPVGARPTFGTNRVSIGNGFPSHAVPESIIPGRPGRDLPAVTVTRRQDVTVSRHWSGALAGAGAVAVWNGSARVAVDVRTARRNGWRLCDENGYPVSFGYGAPVSLAGDGAGWRAVRETRETVVTVRAVRLAGARAMLPPSIVVTAREDENGYPASFGYGAPVVSARGLSERETETAGAPDARRVALLDSGDAWQARPDDAPLTGDLTVSGTLKAYKPVVSPRKRSGGNTGPTVPARLTR